MDKNVLIPLLMPFKNQFQILVEFPYRTAFLIEVAKIQNPVLPVSLHLFFASQAAFFFMLIRQIPLYL